MQFVFMVTRRSTPVPGKSVSGWLIDPQGCVLYLLSFASTSVDVTATTDAGRTGNLERLYSPRQPVVPVEVVPLFLLEISLSHLYS